MACGRSNPISLQHKDVSFKFLDTSMIHQTGGSSASHVPYLTGNLVSYPFISVFIVGVIAEHKL